MACLFSDLEPTRLTAISTAVFFQTISKLIQTSGKKSILITAPELHEEYFPYLSYSATKRNLQRLRKLGILRTKVEYITENGIPTHKTRIWINNKKILELAQQVKNEQELKNMAKRLDKETDKRM